MYTRSHGSKKKTTSKGKAEFKVKKRYRVSKSLHEDELQLLQDFREPVVVSDNSYSDDEVTFPDVYHAPQVDPQPDIHPQNPPQQPLPVHILVPAPQQAPAAPPPAQPIIGIVPVVDVNMSSFKSIQPDKFNGLATEDGREWLRKMETYFKVAGIADDKRAPVFELLMSNLAGVWFNTFSDTDKADYTVIEPAFKLKYINDDANWLTRHKLESRVMSQTETVDEYIQEILLLGQRLNCSQSEQRQALIRGLRPALKAEVVALQPKTFDDTIEKIRLAETVANLKEVSPSGGQQDRSRSQYDKLERKIAELTKQLSASKQSRVGVNAAEAENDTYQQRQQQGGRYRGRGRGQYNNNRSRGRGNQTLPDALMEVIKQWQGSDWKGPPENKPRPRYTSTTSIQDDDYKARGQLAIQAPPIPSTTTSRAQSEN